MKIKIWNALVGGWGGELISTVVEAELRVQQNTDTTHEEAATRLLQNY
jgi:hypothetical protein